MNKVPPKLSVKDFKQLYDRVFKTGVMNNGLVLPHFKETDNVDERIKKFNARIKSNHNKRSS